MYELDEYIRRNREITDLCQILDVLIEQTTLWNNPILGELIDILNDKVSTQLIREDTTLFPAMLNDDDQALNRLAGKSLAHSTLLLRLCNANRARWHNPERADNNDIALQRETRHMFYEIKKHVDMESHMIFPRICGHSTPSFATQ